MRIPTLLLCIIYGETILIISLQEQTFRSLIHVSLSLLSWGLWVRQSPHLQQLQKYSILLRVLVSNMLFTEEEREKWIHTLIPRHWINSHCFTVSVTFSGETQLLLKACYSQGKKNQRFSLTVNSSFLNTQTSLLLPWALKCKYFRKGLLAFKIQNKCTLFLMCFYVD